MTSGAVASCDCVPLRANLGGEDCFRLDSFQIFNIIKNFVEGEKEEAIEILIRFCIMNMANSLTRYHANP